MVSDACSSTSWHAHGGRRAWAQALAKPPPHNKVKDAFAAPALISNLMVPKKTPK
jgi:hypothetical protein